MKSSLKNPKSRDPASQPQPRPRPRQKIVRVDTGSQQEVGTHPTSSNINHSSSTVSQPGSMASSYPKPPPANISVQHGTATISSHTGSLTHTSQRLPKPVASPQLVQAVRSGGEQAQYKVAQSGGERAQHKTVTMLKSQSAAVVLSHRMSPTTSRAAPEIAHHQSRAESSHPLPDTVHRVARVYTTGRGSGVQGVSAHSLTVHHLIVSAPTSTTDPHSASPAQGHNTVAVRDASPRSSNRSEDVAMKRAVARLGKCSFISISHDLPGCTLDQIFEDDTDGLNPPPPPPPPPPGPSHRKSAISPKSKAEATRATHAALEKHAKHANRTKVPKVKCE